MPKYTFVLAIDSNTEQNRVITNALAGTRHRVVFKSVLDDAENIMAFMKRERTSPNRKIIFLGNNEQLDSDLKNAFSSDYLEKATAHFSSLMTPKECLAAIRAMTPFYMFVIALETKQAQNIEMLQTVLGTRHHVLFKPDLDEARNIMEFIRRRRDSPVQKLVFLGKNDALARDLRNALSSDYRKRHILHCDQLESYDACLKKMIALIQARHIYKRLSSPIHSFDQGQAKSEDSYEAKRSATP